MHPDVDKFLRQHGSHSLAYSVRQPGMQYFWQEQDGLIAFRTRMGQHTVLGDPVCRAGGAPSLVERFVRVHPKALFMQVHSGTAELLRNLNYRITPVGVENELDTFAFSLQGRGKRDLRHYRNRARAGEVWVREEQDSTELRRVLKPVSDAWLPMKSWFRHELEFLARPYQLEPEPGVRIFVAYRGERAVGFVVLDPMHTEGVVQGYTVTNGTNLRPPLSFRHSLCGGLKELEGGFSQVVK